MAMEYSPPISGTPPEDWTEDQQFEHEWIGETIFDDMYADPECEGLSEENFDELWQKYRDWYFWGNRKIPGHEHEYDW